MSYKRTSQKCLFCATPCPSTFTIVEGQVKRLKSDPHTEQCHSDPSFLEERGVPILGEQLKVVFILKNLLQIQDEKLCEFLGKFGGQLNPEFWVQLCSTCEEAVHKYYEIFKESFKLQKRLNTISSQLKEQIIQGSRAAADDDDDKVVDEELTEEKIWKEVREEVIKTSPAVLKDYQYPACIFEDENENEDEINIAEAETLVNPMDLLKEEINISNSLFLSPGEAAEPQNADTTSDDNDHDLSTSEIELQNPTCQNSNSYDSGQVKLYTFPDPPNRPPLEYLSFREDRKQRYKCLECLFEAYSFGRIKQHFELHRPGSGAVPCSICGMLVASDPRRMTLHKTTYHPHAVPQLKSGKRKSKSAPWSDIYECADCGAIYQSRARLNVHRKLHMEADAGGEKCMECGWLVKNIAQHVGYWHPLDGTRVAEIRRQKVTGDIYYA
ncbi:unnamed protein product [Orchesella dallaii]|uniref:C2H2-type domain-containing protein n=1 Tax=Orchesella dallaii TaxID=48710 RepID=A0ABP1S4W6_9HEXA